MKRINSPALDNNSNKLLILLVLYKPQKKIVKIINIIEIHTITPYSSAITGK